MRRPACVSPRPQPAGPVRVTVLVNGVPQRLEGDAAADDEDDAAADGEAPVFEDDFDLVSGDGGELELDSDVEDGGAAPHLLVSRLTSRSRRRAARAEGGEFEDDSDIELEEEDYDPTFTTGGVAWCVLPPT